MNQFNRIPLITTSCNLVERFPVLHHSADYICFLWDYWAHCCVLKNEVLLMYTREGVIDVANFISAYEESKKTDTPIF